MIRPFRKALGISFFLQRLRNHRRSKCITLFLHCRRYARLKVDAIHQARHLGLQAFDFLRCRLSRYVELPSQYHSSGDLRSVALFSPKDVAGSFFFGLPAPLAMIDVERTRRSRDIRRPNVWHLAFAIYLRIYAVVVTTVCWQENHAVEAFDFVFCAYVKLFSWLLSSMVLSFYW